MRVFALTFGDMHDASSMYRVHQYVEPLKRLGIDVQTSSAQRFDFARNLTAYDVVLLQKKVLSRAKFQCIRAWSKRLVYDLDEPAGERQQNQPRRWLRNLKISLRLRAIVRSAEGCIVANQVLASRFRRWNSNVVVLPMALDEQVWTPRGPAPLGERRVRIGWAGRGDNLPCLEALEPALLSVQKECPEVQLVVLSSERPEFDELEFQFIPYQVGNETDVMRTLDVGLVPLAPGYFGEGRSPIGGVQYLATGIPSVVSPRGGTREMFREGETALFAQDNEQWTRSLLQLVRNPDLRQEMGQRARKHFEESYALSHTAPRFAQILSSA